MLLRPDRSLCSGPAKITPGNRRRVYSCGQNAVIGLHDGVEPIFTPVQLGHVYEIYPSAGRWKIRNADVQ